MNLPVSGRNDEFVIRRLPTVGLARSLERRRLQFYFGQILTDTAVIFGSFAVAGLFYIGSPNQQSVVLPAELLFPLYLTIAFHNGSYSLNSLRDWRVSASRALSALIISAVFVNFVAFFAKINAEFSRGAFAIALVLASVAITALRRVAVDWIGRNWGPNPLNVLVIEDDGPPVDMRNTYRANAKEIGLRPSLDDPQALDLLAQHVRHMDQVIVSCPAERRVAWALVLKGSGVHGEVMSDFMREIGALGVVNREEFGMTTLVVSTGPLGLRARATKRLLDMSISLVALILALPILLGAALAIKLEDKGPVLFRQNRVGRRNELFSIYKLRTMKVESADGDGKRSASKNDDRVTRVGKFLRRTSIDELPQLLNVLKGDMSLVGPRPHAIGSLAGDKLFWEVDPRYWQRHSLRPGLTGLAQIRGFRGATDLETDLTARLQADLEYINGWTLWRDVRILLATTMVLFHDRAF